MPLKTAKDRIIVVAVTEPGHGQSDVPVQEISLGLGLTLVMAAARPVDSDDLEAIRAAASPLLKVLEKRLLRKRPE